MDNPSSIITKRLYEKLKLIKPNHFNYYPCIVTLKNGKEQDFVYLVDVKTFIKSWGHNPREDSGKKFISIEDVVDIRESPSRLPAHVVSKLNNAGETRMGCVIAKYVFNDGQEFSLINAHDFIEYPKGKTANDLKEVIPHKWDEDKLKNGPMFYYCFFDKVD